LDKAHVFRNQIVTEVAPLDVFYSAEPYHQNYFAQHPNDLYIVINDAPKVDRLRTQFPQLYR
jgi:peptide-methionine (S)-S-oxide reductase